MNKIAPLLLAAALIAGPAKADAPPPKTDGGKVICRVEAASGSRLGVRRCQTAAQWAELRVRSRELVEYLQQANQVAGQR